MALPVVAIIGRPNVGKSSLLNALAGQMISIVEPTAGVTRDRVGTYIGRGDKYFELIDTGGYGIVDADQLSDHIEQQIMQAIASAQIVINHQTGGGGRPDSSGDRTAEKRWHVSGRVDPGSSDHDI